MDWVGAALNVIGLYLLAEHRLLAMYVYAVSSVSFLVWAVLNGVWSLVALQSVLLVLNVRVIITWRRNGSNNSPTN